MKEILKESNFLPPPKPVAKHAILSQRVQNSKGGSIAQLVFCAAIVVIKSCTQVYILWVLELMTVVKTGYGEGKG